MISLKDILLNEAPDENYALDQEINQKLASFGPNFRHTFSNGMTLRSYKNVFMPKSTAAVVNGFLKDLIKAFPKKRINITSAYRDEYNQSRVMYDNWRANGRKQSYLTGLYGAKKIARKMHQAFKSGTDKASSIEAGKQVLLHFRSKGRHISNHQFANALDLTGNMSIVKRWIRKGGSKFATRVVDEGNHLHVKLAVQHKSFPPDGAESMGPDSLDQFDELPTGTSDPAITPGISNSPTYDLEFYQDVKDAQIILYELGYDLGPYGEKGEGKDGKLGPYTSEALKQFQHVVFNDAESWTGKLDDKTKEKLQNLTSAEKLVIQKENNQEKADDLVAKTKTAEKLAPMDWSKIGTANVYYNKLPADVKKAVDKLRKLGVNITEYHLKREFDQEGSTQPDLGPNKAAEKAVVQLVSAIRAQFPNNSDVQAAQGIKSGYRSYNKQVTNFARKVKKGRSIDDVQAANTIPGFSQHHTGKAYDILSTESSWWNKNSDVGAWVEKNAPKYGLEVTYKKKGVLRIAEPWHLFYTR